MKNKKMKFKIKALAWNRTRDIVTCLKLCSQTTQLRWKVKLPGVISTKYSNSMKILISIITLYSQKIDYAHFLTKILYSVQKL